MPEVDTGNTEQDDAELLARSMRGAQPGNTAEDWGNIFLRAAQNPLVRPASFRYLNPSPDEDLSRITRSGPPAKALSNFAAVTNSQPAPVIPVNTGTQRVPHTIQPTISNNGAAGPPVPPDEEWKTVSRAAAMGGAYSTPTPQSHLSQVPPMPKPPMMNPGFAGNEADIRNRSAITPKYDPITGKTLDKYYEGVGGRIGRAFVDLARGGVPGVVEGAFGNPNDPGYYGKGAVNRQYSRDEAARQQGLSADLARRDSFLKENEEAQKDYKNSAEWQKDETKRAYEQDISEERQRHQKETEDLQQQNADIRQQLADAKDPEAKAQAELRARTTIADQMQLKGKERQRYIMYGDKSSLDEYHQQQLGLAEQRIGLLQERLNLAEQKETRQANTPKFNVQKELSDAEKDRDAAHFKNDEQFKKDWDNAYKDSGGKPSEAVLDSLKTGHANRAGQINQTYDDRVKTIKATPPAQPANGATRNGPSADTVRVQKPDGSTGTIPRANIAKAKGKGWKILNETPGPQGQ